MTEPIPMDPAPPSARRRMEINPPVFIVTSTTFLRSRGSKPSDSSSGTTVAATSAATSAAVNAL